MEIETRRLVSQGFGDDSRKNCWRMEGTEKTAERKEKEYLKVCQELNLIARKVISSRLRNANRATK